MTFWSIKNSRDTVAVHTILNSITETHLPVGWTTRVLDVESTQSVDYFLAPTFIVEMEGRDFAWQQYVNSSLICQVRSGYNSYPVAQECSDWQLDKIM